MLYGGGGGRYIVLLFLPIKQRWLFGVENRII